MESSPGVKVHQVQPTTPTTELTHMSVVATPLTSQSARPLAPNSQAKRSQKCVVTRSTALQICLQRIQSAGLLDASLKHLACLTPTHMVMRPISTQPHILSCRLSRCTQTKVGSWESVGRGSTPLSVHSFWRGRLSTNFAARYPWVEMLLRPS